MKISVVKIFFLNYHDKKTHNDHNQLHTDVQDASGNDVAEPSAPFLAFGTCKFISQAIRRMQGPVIEMKPVVVGRRTESFVKDNVLYFWDAEKVQHDA